MNLEIGLTLALIVATLIAFVREISSPDVIALTVLVAVVALGLVEMERMTEVFMNEAPLTIAALFVIGGALEKSGAVEAIGRALESALSGNVRLAILAFSVVAAFFSAWMNNTAIVAILLPVTLGFARAKGMAASRLLMPLSYASILGGCCTLIGTSTNLVVNGSLEALGERPMGMFEVAAIGLPLAVVGIAYLTIFGPKLIPGRESVAGSLRPEDRKVTLLHVLIGEGAALVNCRLLEGLREMGLGSVKVLEVRRDGGTLSQALDEVVVARNDRLLFALSGNSKNLDVVNAVGGELLSSPEGIVTELVVLDEASIVGMSLVDAGFRQRYSASVIAVHRDGWNVTSEFVGVKLAVGDSLLVVVPVNQLGRIKKSRDFLLTDLPKEEVLGPRDGRVNWRARLTWSVLLGMVLTVTLSEVLRGSFPVIPKLPIHYCALVAVLVLLWSKVTTSREAYESIDWQVLLMLYGLLGLGLAMQTSGTAAYLAGGLESMCGAVFSEEWLPYALLWLVFLMTLLLTEVLSNNATAAMMVPVVVTLAHSAELNSRPFVMAVTIAASCAFALPMGYQTHLMVYSPGGYKFRDFLRVGIPLNAICWVVSCTLIPLIWPLKGN